MRLRLSLAAVAAMILPLAAHAQPVTGPYVTLEAGTSIQYPLSYALPNVGSGASSNTYGKLQMRPSYAGDTGVGYGFGDGFRVQIDGDFIRSTVHRLDFVQYNTGASGGFRVTGGENMYGPMANILYDINVGLPVYPYVGGGVGYQWVKFNSHIEDSAGDIVAGGTKGSLAFDVIGGLAYPIPAVPGLSLTIEYRFKRLQTSRNYGAYLAGPGCRCSDSIGPQALHIFMAGLRYQLLNPPPPIPTPTPAPVTPPPAPVVAKTYLVFFDWDRYNLTPRALSIISQAASDSKTNQVTTLQVSGYTDTSGTAVYNLGLSLRRAHAVAAQLVADGVPESEIETHGYGETHLLVPTGPGVREPQNRRVEIVE